MSPILALLIALVIAALAWRAGALVASGAATATLIGAALLAAQDWPGGVLLLSFFVPTSLVSRLLPDATARLDAKGNRRDGWQVLANGGAAALGALLTPHSLGGMLIAAAALAAAAADTWATSWGSGSASLPRSIISGRTVPAGTSGGMTWRGSIGGAVGALVVAATAAALTRSWQLCVITVIAGMAGMVLDSLLGALVQGRFHCDQCDMATERAVHRCGARTRLLGGVRWMNNDAVNFLATAAAGAAAWVAFSV